MTADDFVEEAARRIAISAVASRMARAPLEIQLEPFLSLPVRAETWRLPSKATRIRFSIGPHSGQRIVSDQRAAKIHAAARTTVRAVLGEAAISFIFKHQ